MSREWQVRCTEYNCDDEIRARSCAWRVVFALRLFVVLVNRPTKLILSLACVASPHLRYVGHLLRRYT